jgi:hypothetical protein
LFVEKECEKMEVGKQKKRKTGQAAAAEHSISSFFSFPAQYL